MTDNFDPREVALAEARDRVKSSATRMIWHTGALAEYEINIGVQVWSGENLDLDFMNEANFSDLSDPGELADTIYEFIASRLPERAVEVSIRIEDSCYAVSYKSNP
jgi:hypothetical protein